MRLYLKLHIKSILNKIFVSKKCYYYNNFVNNFKSNLLVNIKTNETKSGCSMTIEIEYACSKECDCEYERPKINACCSSSTIVLKCYFLFLSDKFQRPLRKKERKNKIDK